MQSILLLNIQPSTNWKRWLIGWIIEAVNMKENLCWRSYRCLIVVWNLKEAMQEKIQWAWWQWQTLEQREEALFVSSSPFDPRVILKKTVDNLLGVTVYQNWYFDKGNSLVDRAIHLNHGLGGSSHQGSKVRKNNSLAPGCWGIYHKPKRKTEYRDGTFGLHDHIIVYLEDAGWAILIFVDFLSPT